MLNERVNETDGRADRALRPYACPNDLPRRRTILLVEDEPYARRTQGEKIEKILAGVPLENVPAQAG